MMSENTSLWRYPSPYTQPWHIKKHDIDHYQHVNNVAYLRNLESLAWAHSNALGLYFDDYKALNRGMVIQRHELDYKHPVHEGNTLTCGTWITHYDGKLTLQREFQFVCPTRGVTVFEAKTFFVCVSIATGQPKRMPEKFKTIYGNACIKRNDE